MKKLFKKLSQLGFERGLAYVTVGNVFSSVLGAVLWLYLASQLTASHYGEINYLIAVASIAAPLALMGFDTTLVSYLAKGSLKMESESSALIVISLIAVSAVLFVLLQSLSVVIATISMVLWTWVVADMLGRQEFKKYAIGMTAQRILTLVAVPLFYLFFSVDGAIYGYAISNLVLCSRYFRVVRQMDFSISSIAPIRNYFLHSYFIGLAKTLPYFADKLMILPLFDALTVGYYQFGAQFALFGSIVPLVLFNYLLPRQSKGESKKLRNTKMLGIISSTVITLGLFLLMPFIVDHFFPRFQPAITATQIIILSGIPLSFSAIYNSNFMALGRSSPVVVGTILFLVAQFFLIYTLGNLYSLIGLSAATLIASSLQCMFLSYSNRTLRNSMT